MIGRTLGHYRIIKKIGAGGMGEVYLARDERLERAVAVKALPAGTLADENVRKRFRKEALTLSRLNHQYIATVHDYDSQDGIDFLVMEYVEGETLADKLRSGPLPEAEIFRLGLQIAEALEEAHGAGVIHRDLKPHNIALNARAQVKVLDFGIAKLLHRAEETGTVDTITQTAGISGTLAYMAPEQLRGQPADARTDVHAFGVVLYEMATGRRPFSATTPASLMEQILTEDPAPPSKLHPGTSPELEAIILRCLAKNPDQRFQTAGDVRAALTRSPAAAAGSPARLLEQVPVQLRKPKVKAGVSTALFVLVLLAAGAGWWLNRRAHIRRAVEVTLPEIERLVETSWRDYTDAYALAVEAEKYIPESPRLADLLAKSSLKISVNTEPAGAAVSMKRYGRPDSAWEYLGVTPLEETRVPIGIFRWKIEKEGYETILAADSTWNIGGGGTLLKPNNLSWVLDEEGKLPPGMVRVRGGETAAGEFGDFYIDRYEITNKQYKDFLDHGGYANRIYWTQDFVDDGKTLTWEEALTEFVDQTSRPGPATWQGGDYPDGQSDYPVGGISWYEAAAYCEFAGKSLPTGYHWGLARGEDTPVIKWPQLGGFAVFAPFSNIGAGTGPVPVGSLGGITAFGAADMAGNVREWVWNETERGRVIRGGAWNSNTYMFNRWSQLPALDRSPENGFRCAVYPEPEALPPSAYQAAEPTGEFGVKAIKGAKSVFERPPIAESVFQIYKQRFSYDPANLNARIESRDESSEKWIHETITFDAAYGNERVIAHLFLPRNSSAPFQTVIYFPGSATWYRDSSENIAGYYEYESFLSFIVKNGRAVLFPVYKGTFERRDNSMVPNDRGRGAPTHKVTEYRSQLVKDFRRSIDYLETRPDINAEKIAFYGVSWGGMMGAIIPAVEERIKASVLLAGGFMDNSRPEVNQATYAPRVKVPTLMINGRYDTLLPLDLTIEPLFERLGTPDDQKELKLYDTDHIPPMNEFIKETLAWLDRYLGPVE